MAKLYILTKDGGDGSCYPEFILDERVINILQELYDANKIGYEEGYGDGDGFHYATINVPDDSTAKSLDVSLTTYEEALQLQEEYS